MTTHHNVQDWEPAESTHGDEPCRPASQPVEQLVLRGCGRGERGTKDEGWTAKCSWRMWQPHTTTSKGGLYGTWTWVLAGKAHKGRLKGAWLAPYHCARVVLPAGEYGVLAGQAVHALVGFR